MQTISRGKLLILYKYYPLNDYSIRALAIGGLWCHYPREMNDPLECLAGSPLELGAGALSILGKFAEKTHPLSVKLKTMSGNQRKRVVELLRDELIARFSFCALSEIPDHPLMWSHYANGHRGCAIGISFDDDLEGHLQPVVYSNRPESFPWKDMVDDFVDQEETGNSDLINKILKNISIKADCWSYEREWRVWRNRPGYYRYEQSRIKDVFFGVRCPPELQMAVAKLLDKLPDGTGYKVMELKFDPIRLEP